LIPIGSIYLAHPEEFLAIEYDGFMDYGVLAGLFDDLIAIQIALLELL
jgi:hypothetical protein